VPLPLSCNISACIGSKIRSERSDRTFRNDGASKSLAVIFRQHVERKNIGRAVVIYIGDVISHRKNTRMPDAILQLVRERAVAVIDVAK
jgi:hypothetical protein